MCSGNNGCMGHYTAKKSKIKYGLSFLETGGCYKRYHASLMRSFYLKERNEIPEFIFKIENIVNRALKEF